MEGALIELTLGPGATTSSLDRTGGTWSFSPDQAFEFNIIPGASGTTTYDDLITGLTGTESGLPDISFWTIKTPGVTGTFFYDGAGDIDLQVVTIPEPASPSTLLAGLLALTTLPRFRRRRP
jgi:MYXO-CTERM domain-containing protein